MSDLSNKVAVVTASSRGIGLAIAKKLVNDGATVYMAVRDSIKNRELIKQLSAINDRYKGVIYNATDFNTYEPMFQKIVKESGSIDILVNNFGTTSISYDKTLTTGDNNCFFDIINKDIGSVYYACRYAVKNMLKNNSGGSIINISSIGGEIPDVSRLAYTTSKAAINSLTKNIAVQYAKYKIRCNAVLPGLVNTDGAMDNMSKKFLNTFLQNVPLNSIIEPRDIACAVAFLASDDSRFITGELLPVNGGFGLPTPIYSDIMNGHSTLS